VVAIPDVRRVPVVRQREPQPFREPQLDRWRSARVRRCSARTPGSACCFRRASTRGSGQPAREWLRGRRPSAGPSPVVRSDPAGTARSFVSSKPQTTHWRDAFPPSAPSRKFGLVTATPVRGTRAGGRYRYEMLRHLRQAANRCEGAVSVSGQLPVLERIRMTSRSETIGWCSGRRAGPARWPPSSSRAA
jgi:hypothetical protein